jgi:hypothetical protein
MVPSFFLLSFFLPHARHSERSEESLFSFNFRLSLRPKLTTDLSSTFNS